MGNQVYTNAPWAIMCTPMHHGQLVVHQRTMGNYVYTSAGQAGDPQLFSIQCTMGKQVYTSALWASRCTTVHICKFLNGDEKFNVMFLTWWCSLCASERGLTNGYGHSSIYCIQQSNWKIKMTCVYSDNCISTSVGRGVASGQGWNILVLYDFSTMF